MTIPSPLQSKLEQLQVEYEVEHKETQREGAASGQFQSQLLSEFLPWGDGGCNILATVGIVELEYAAIHKSVGVFDAACRGTIELSGKDRLDCMNRLSKATNPVMCRSASKRLLCHLLAGLSNASKPNL